MAIPKSIQARALAYLLEQQLAEADEASVAVQSDSLTGTPRISDAVWGTSTHEDEREWLWLFLTERYPAEVDELRAKPAMLVQDLYRDEFNRWARARRRANMSEQERFVWDLAMGNDAD